VPYIDALSPLALIVGLTVIFLPLCYLFPSADVGLREAVPGAVVAALGWASLDVFYTYVQAASQYEAYGVTGGVLLLVTWLYFSGFVLLFGVVINVVVAGRAAEPEDESETASRWRNALARSRRLWRDER
jgi:membrane protein